MEWSEQLVTRLGELQKEQAVLRKKLRTITGEVRLVKTILGGLQSNQHYTAGPDQKKVSIRAKNVAQKPKENGVPVNPATNDSI